MIADKVKAAAKITGIIGDYTYLVRLDGETLLAVLFIQPNRRAMWRNIDVEGSESAANDLIEQEKLIDFISEQYPVS